MHFRAADPVTGTKPVLVNVVDTKHKTWRDEAEHSYDEARRSKGVQ